MKDKLIKQPWPRSAKITVWVLSLILVPALFYAVIVDPNPCRHQPVVLGSPRISSLPVVKLLAYKLKDQRNKHPEDFLSPQTEDEKFIKEILDAEDPREYLQSIGYD